MELANIEKLIAKYLEAETSIAEEITLKTYFSSTDVAPHLEQYKPLFQYFANAKNETYTKTVPLQPRKKHFRWTSVAAVFVLGFSLYMTGDFYIKYEEEKKAKEAYFKTKEALQLLSGKFNKGAGKVAYLNEFEQTKNQIFKTKE